MTEETRYQRSKRIEHEKARHERIVGILIRPIEEEWEEALHGGGGSEKERKRGRGVCGHPFFPSSAPPRFPSRWRREP